MKCKNFGLFLFEVQVLFIYEVNLSEEMTRH